MIESSNSTISYFYFSFFLLVLQVLHCISDISRYIKNVFIIKQSDIYRKIRFNYLLLLLFIFGHSGTLRECLHLVPFSSVIYEKLYYCYPLFFTCFLLVCKLFRSDFSITHFTLDMFRYVGTVYIIECLVLPYIEGFFSCLSVNSMS